MPFNAIFTLQQSRNARSLVWKTKKVALARTESYRKKFGRSSHFISFVMVSIKPVDRLVVILRFAYAVRRVFNISDVPASYGHQLADNADRCNAKMVATCP